MDLAQRWALTCEDVALACQSAGRDRNDVRIIAVSKTVEPETVGQAIACGMQDFGENREKPFNEKLALYPQVNWHFIGTLQSNKAKQVVGKAHLIHSLDRASLLQALQKEAAKLAVVQDVLVEVSVSGEQSKGGIAPDKLPEFLEELASCENLFCKGLMTMAPQGDLHVARKTFESLRELSEKMSRSYSIPGSIELTELSMGMSEDYREAIAEGATCVRIGRRIFSEDFTAHLQ